LPTDIILFYNPEDKSLPVSFIDGGRPAIKKYQQVIEAIHIEPLSEKDLMRKTNLRQTPLRVIKADLIEQGIIREANFGKSKKFEYVTGAPALNFKSFEELRKTKTSELEKMLEYVETKDSRMRFLCQFLGDPALHNHLNCDNTGLKKRTIENDPLWEKKLKDFREDYFPILEVESAHSKIVNGSASSFYGFSNVGAAIHRSKYEDGGDFPDFLLILTLRAFRKKYGEERFDLIVYVPPTKSGTLVQIFAEKLSKILGIPISHDLIKSRVTSEQKIFENHTLKNDNVKDAFIFRNPGEVYCKKILLVDDVFDSGATIKEIGRYFTNLGAEKIAPLVIAKTVGGDLND
jgi:ATP-dependent DNA helicase RecQ